MPLSPFHLAIPVTDLTATRQFFQGLLGCSMGREDSRWIDFNFFGHQVTAHLVDSKDSVVTNPVDGEEVPARHFGVVLPWVEWEALADRLQRREVSFLIPPHIRFRGEAGEQATFFIQDPSRNALEFKSFRDIGQLFAR